MIRKLSNSKIMIFILIACALLIPATINIPEQPSTYSLVLGVGIDKSENEYEVSTQILTSKTNQGFLESLQVHSATAGNILLAVEKLALHLGKISGFGSTSVIVFSEEVAKEGIAETLDFFLRSKRLNGNPFLIVTNKSAKSVLSDVAKIDESFNYSLNSLAKLNSEASVGAIMTLVDFMNNYYSGTTASVISQINETTQENQGILIPSQNDSSGSAGANGGAVQTMASQAVLTNASASTNDSQKKVVSNDGYSSLFVGAKQIATLTPKDCEGMNTLLNLKRNVFTVKDVNDEVYHNATVVLSIKDVKKTRVLKFSNQGVPRVYYTIKYALKVEQIREKNNDEIVLSGISNYLTPTLSKMLTNQIKQTASDAINLFKKYNADVYGLQQAFYKHHPKQWQKYLHSLQNGQNAFKNIEFFVDLQLSGNV